MAKIWIFCAALLAVAIYCDALASCPVSSKMTSCSPKCKDDTQCFGKRCCPNICNTKSCAPDNLAGDDDKYKTSKAGGTGSYCGSVKCNSYEKCEMDRSSKKQKCVRT